MPRSSHTTMDRHSPMNRHAAPNRASHQFTQRTHGLGLYSSEVDIEPVTSVDLGEGAVTEGSIVDGAISITKYADTIRPVAIVSSLPTLPDADYPEFCYVVLTSDNRLYKNIGNVWVLGVDGADIVADSITAGQIAAGAIAASEIAAGAVTASKLAVGAVRTNLLKNGDFEEGTAAYGTAGTEVPGWTLKANTTYGILSSANVKSGAGVLGFKSVTGTQANVGAQQIVPVIPGRTYRLSGWNWKGAGSGDPSRFRANTVGADGSTVINFNVIQGTSNDTTTPVFSQGYYTVPATGSIPSYIRVDCHSIGTPGNTEVFAFEDVVLELLPASFLNSAATVTIDETGITVLNGALVLQDEFGKTAMEASGFSGSWFDFIGLGLYNSRFLSGTTGALTMNRSALMPYWTLSQQAGTPTASKLSTGGVEVSFSALNDTLRLMSDSVPIQPDLYYGLTYMRSITRVAGTLTCTAYIFFYDSAGAYISSTNVSAIGVTVTSPATTVEASSTKSPNTAFYARAVLDVNESSSHSASNKVNILMASLRPAPHPPNPDMIFSVDTLQATTIDASQAQNSLMFLSGLEVPTGPIFIHDDISPTALAANTNDWNPTGLSSCTLIRVGTDATPRTLTGISAPASDGRVIWLHNRNSGTALTLSHDATSTGANRFYCPGATDFTLTAKTTVMLMYSGTDSRWLVMD